MPQVFKIGSYWVYFWTNENDPLEPVHVSCCRGKPAAKCNKDLDYPNRQVPSC